MRPIRLEISGLNSYVEKQVIDFSQLTSRGLFGIFGKTGSGKSTILDAMTIAMYGNISRNTNEFINTSCDRASIKYEFELGNKHNKKRYEVIRVFKSNSGSANSYSAVLSEIHDDGKKDVIAEKKTNVDKAIVNIVGLTASDFTRSVVLPQGKFSEFLQLDDRNRREMLERIFNLEKYGKALTDKVKAKKQDKSSKIEILENSIAQYNGVSKEIFEETYKALEELQKDTRAKKQELDESKKKYDEFKEIMSYQEALEQRENRKKKLDEASNEIQESRVIVERSGHAKIVKPHIENFEEAESSIKDYDFKLKKLDEAYTAANREYESTKMKYDEALREKNSSLEGLISNRQKFERAIGLEANLKDTALEIEKLNLEIYNLEQSKNSIQKKKADLEEQQNKLNRNIKENQDRIDELKISESDKAKINEAFEKEKELNRLKLELDSNKRSQSELQKGIDELSAKFSFVERASKDLKSQLESLEANYNRISSKCPGTSDDLMAKSNSHLNLKTKLENTKKNEEKINELQIKLNNEKEEKFKLDREVESIKTKVENLQKDRERLKSDLNEERILNLANSLKSELKEGYPCPVCGSHHHPNADLVHNDGKRDKIESDIKKIEESLQQENINYNNVIVRQSSLTSSINMTEQSIKEIKSQISISSVELEGQVNQLAKELETLRNNINTWEADKQKLEQEIKVVEENKNKKEKEEIELSTDISNKKSNMSILNENIEKLSKQCEVLSKECLYMKSSLKIDDLKAKVEEINNNSRIVEEKELQNKKLRAGKEKIDEELKLCVDSYMEADKKVYDFNKNKDVKIREKRDAEAELNQITKGKNPKQLLDNTLQEINRINSTEAKLRVELDGQKDRTEKLKSQLIQMKGKLEEANKKYKSSKLQLDKLLLEYKFESIYAVKNCIVPEEERERLKDKIEFFEKEEKILAIEIANLKKNLNNRTVNPAEYLELEKTKYRLEDELEKANKEIGAKQNEVKVLKENLDKLNLLQRELDEEVHQLGLLKEIENLLKGKRFVEFVAKNQLEYIVMEASKRLDQMTKGRYVLEIDENLNFIMRDNYNGGLRRGIKTLSGGETFLTSLSLALALSSQIQLKGSAPLEFFFLDEGFGSLDTELLDVVMESLEKLHSERLSVGIISHVEELKNRVPVKLVVTSNDGASGSKVDIEYS